jgi:plasmid stability protein
MGQLLFRQLDEAMIAPLKVRAREAIGKAAELTVE